MTISGEAEFGIVSETDSCSATASSTSLCFKLVFSVVTQISSLSSYRPESRHSSYRESVRLKIGETRPCGLFSPYGCSGKAKAKKSCLLPMYLFQAFIHRSALLMVDGRKLTSLPERSLSAFTLPHPRAGFLSRDKSGTYYMYDPVRSYLRRFPHSLLLYATTERRKTCGYRRISCFT